MANLDNSNRRLLEGLVSLLRENVSGWSQNSEYSVANVWTKQAPTDVEDEFPRGVVDIIGGSDFDLSVELDVNLREVIVRVVVFGENSGAVEDLIDDSENALVNHWDSNAPNNTDWDTYAGDWSFREMDGFTALSEDGEIEGKLRYNRSIDLIFETVKESN